MNCSRSSIFVLPLATVCCVHAVREEALGDAGYMREEVPERDLKFAQKTKERERERDDIEVR